MSPPAGCRRRRPCGRRRAPLLVWRGELVSLFPWVPGRTSVRAEVTPAHAAAVGAALAALHRAGADVADHRPGRYEPDEIARRLARVDGAGATRAGRRASRRWRPSWRPGGPSAPPTCRSGTHPRRSLHRQRAVRSRRSPVGADRLRAGVLGAPGLRSGGHDAGVRLRPRRLSRRDRPRPHRRLRRRSPGDRRRAGWLRRRAPLRRLPLRRHPHHRRPPEARRRRRPGQGLQPLPRSPGQGPCAHLAADDGLFAL